MEMPARALRYLITDQYAHMFALCIVALRLMNTSALILTSFSPAHHPYASSYIRILVCVSFAPAIDLRLLA